MTDITMCISGAVMELCANGHAGYADPGKDIVCAAASCLINTLMLALNAQTSPPTEIGFNAGDGGGPPLTIHCRASPEDRPAAEMMFKTIGCGLEALAYKYPEHVRFTLRQN